MGLTTVQLEEDQIDLIKQLVEAELDINYTEQEPLSDEAENYRALLTDTLDTIVQSYSDYNDSMDGDFDSAMTSAGFGTDEDYGYTGE